MRQTLRCARLALIATLLLVRLAGAACKVEAVAGIVPTDPSGSPTNVQVFPAAAPSDGAALNAEGLSERLSDVLVHDDGQLPNCFAFANTITIVYSVAVTT